MTDISPEMEAAAARQVKGATIAWGGGRIYDFENPNPEIITLEDIAFALAYTVRWRGQARYPTGMRQRCFFGVGQHCVFGAEEMLTAGHDPARALAFLWHEADEVVLPDMAGPVKPLLPGYKPLAKRQGQALLDHYGIEIVEPDLIKRWDCRMLVTEKRDLLHGHEGDHFQNSEHGPVPDTEFPPFDRVIMPYSHPDAAAHAWLYMHRKLADAL